MRCNEHCEYCSCFVYIVQVVKLYAWEKAFSKVISDYRMAEIRMYIRFYALQGGSTWPRTLNLRI